MFTDGGKQNLQRDGFYRRGPLKVTQHMVYQVEIKFFFEKLKSKSNIGVRWADGRSGQGLEDGHLREIWT